MKKKHVLVYNDQFKFLKKSAVISNKLLFIFTIKKGFLKTIIFS